uniref:Uncharacterized protein n=1 Tax=Setaria italica TaxID=4555 RepID=K4AN80_SETIT
MLYPHFHHNEAWEDQVVIPTVLFICLDIVSTMFSYFLTLSPR